MLQISPCKFMKEKQNVLFLFFLSRQPLFLSKVHNIYFNVFLSLF